MIETQKTGSKDGKDIFVYTFSSEAGGCMKVTNYGGTIMSVEMPDADGNRADVVLGFDTPEEYFGDHPFFGATVGRYANPVSYTHLDIIGVYGNISVSGVDKGAHAQPARRFGVLYVPLLAC